MLDGQRSDDFYQINSLKSVSVSLAGLAAKALESTSELPSIIFCARRMSKVKMPKTKKSFARQPFNLRLIPGPPGIKLASRPGIWDKSPTAAGRRAESAGLVHRYAPSPRPKWRQRSRPGQSRQSRAVSLQKGCVSEILRGRKNRLLRRRNAQRGAPRAQFDSSLAG